ncbi:MAG: clan AA aspartic protease [Deltaproteobacteria bacterium]|nr:clan AA aspartic protease [Deltaproteobacteria bacterium]
MRRGIVSLITFVFFLMTGVSVFADDTLPFTERNHLKYVTVYLNETPLELVFDTGANNIVLNRDALQRLGISEFTESHKIQSHTAGGVVAGYIITINSIRAGNMQKKDYPVTFVPSSTENLLGANFFTGYSYYIDEDYKVIRLVPKGRYFFDNPDQPAAMPLPQPLPQPTAPGSGRIEVEMDGEKYIYDGDRLIRQDQALPR